MTQLDISVAAIIAIRALWLQNYQVIFCSGRTEACRTATEQWLLEHIGPIWVELLMRPVGDTRQDSVVKLELFNNHIRHNYDVAGVV